MKMSTMSSKITYFKDGQILTKTIPNFSEINDVDDPTPWFGKQEKPVLRVKMLSGQSSEIKSSLKSYVLSAADNNVDVEAVNSYLYYFGKELFREKLDKEWKLTSKISIKPDIITPFDLLNIQDAGKLSDANLISDFVTDKEDIEIIIMILANYRINSLNRNALSQYRNQLKTNMNATFKASKFIEADIPNNIYTYTSWVNDPDFKKICAAFDLFFKKFPTSKYSPLRMCVQGARYKDCSLLTDIMFAKSMIGVDDFKLFTLAVDASVNKELMRYLDYIGEDCLKDGYFPYLKELGVINKSPYSASQSPNAHNWIHMMGSLLGETRSVNSRLAPNGQNIQVLNLAIVCAYALKSRSDINPVFGENDEIMELRKIAGGASETSLDPGAIIENLNDLINETPIGTEIMSWARGKIRILSDVRDGSIGKYLVEQLH